MVGWGFGMDYQMLVWGIVLFGVVGLSIYLLVNLLTRYRKIG